ncbi:hypothetical protein BJ878DRAFT_509297 [Calycina marina]|uniref:Uncharacterized protein n=1 Tax=Calycina marina TaxID=1763456 RepID=A0A9P7Z1X4_9HELO|nr:hypothetical protein BJ878DRAFT_509297 [Calycina marina]
MHTIFALSALFFSSIASASPHPITKRAASCPQIFSLNISTPGHTFSGLPIIQSGRSTYLTTTPLIAEDGDTLARFYRNDSTHLYATGFNTDYMGQHQTPPYQMITFDFGFNIFAMDPVGAERTYTYIDESYSVNSVTEGLNFMSVDGGPNGWFVCGGEDETVWQVIMGTVNAGVDGSCFPVSMSMYPLAPIAADVC